MGHHGRKYGYEYGGHRRGAGLALEALRRMPRSLKIALALIVLFLALLAVVVVVLVALALVKLLAGGALPGYLQGAMDFLQRNLQPLLDLWKNLQSVTGK